MYFNGLYSRKLSTMSCLLNSKIKSLVQQHHFIEALQVYTIESHSPLNTSKFTFPSLLKACSSLSNLRYGKAIHATIIQMGLQFDSYITTSLVNMYTRCDSFNNARHVFDNMYKFKRESLAQDVTIWNAMIDGLFRNGLVEEGFTHFRQMQTLGLKPDGYSLSILLGVTDHNKLVLSKGMEIHAYVVRNMFDNDSFIVTALIEMYSNYNKPMNAWCIFKKLKDTTNIAVWNVMINGFCKHGMWIKSLELYLLLKKNKNCEIVSVTFASILTACSQGKDLEFGTQIHSDVVKMGFETDPYTCTSLLTMYSKCGVINDAFKIFSSIKIKKVEIWNAMISAYIINDRSKDAYNIYNQMRVQEIPSDCFTISNVLASCTTIDLYNFGRLIHGDLIKRPIIQNNVTVQSSLLTMYSRFGTISQALEIFNTMKEKDLVAWGSMISGYCQNGKLNEALNLFKSIEFNSVKPDPNLLANVINACARLKNEDMGCSIHAYVIKFGFESHDAFVGSSLIDLYSKCGQVKNAKIVFDDIKDKNLVIWNSLMSCYCQNGLPELSLSLLHQLNQHSLYPDSVSITNALVAVSLMAVLVKGKAVHCYYIRHLISNGISNDIQVENTLLDMYVKCGSLKYAQCLFHNMFERNVVTWNSMISGYGTHGECVKAIKLFNEMRDLDIKPDDVTFLTILSSCNHSGFVDEGLKLFQLMMEYKIEPKIEHYVNIIDLLGRANRLDEALNLIQNMRMKSERSIWVSLLSACRVNCNVKLGELAAKKLIELDPNGGSNYVQLLNIYVEAGLYEEAAKLRVLMKQKGLKKVPGCSWIEVKNKVDVFYASDSSSSSKTIEIYQILDSLRNNMKRSVNYYEAVEA